MGNKRKADAKADDEAGSEIGSKKHCSGERPQEADNIGVSSQSRPTLEIFQAPIIDPQADQTTEETQKSRGPPRTVPRGNTPSPTNPGESPTFSDSASNYDINMKFRISGLPTFSEVKRWKDKGRPAKFIRSPSGLGSARIGKRPFGRGTYGLAGLREKYDDDYVMTEVRLHSQAKERKGMAIEEA